MDHTLGSLREFPLFSLAILLLAPATIGSLALTQQTQVLNLGLDVMALQAFLNEINLNCRLLI